jgi:2Fe-2S thioredoxin-like protein
MSSLIPGFGLVKGMAITLRRFFEPKATIMYPETPATIPHKFRGRLQLLYDEWGTLKCETCFQCAQACPIECIDMGGTDTKGRYHVHWGAAETYGERREESALRRSGRTVPDAAYAHFEQPDDLAAVDEILDEFDRDPEKMLRILEATQARYGHLPVAALKRISHATGAWYAMIYGTATYYSHLRFEPPVASSAQVAEAPKATPRGRGKAGPAARATPPASPTAPRSGRPSEGAYLDDLDRALGGSARRR